MPLNNQDKFDQFIIASRKIHGERYDYSSVNYINSKTKVSIICPIHGIFEKQPNKHLASKQGCPICGLEHGSNSRRQGKDIFIAKASELHGDKYIYDKIEYTNNSSKVIIGCRIHGDFQQIPNSHLLGRGCPTCARNVQLNTQEFIRRAKSVHGEIYDYSRSVYKAGRNKIQISCPKHGAFMQSAEAHLRGNGCNKCSGNEKLDTNSFIALAKSVHGEKYDYSLVNYIGNKCKIKIICREHGLFEQQAKSHLRRGQGCPYCAGVAKISVNEFIRRAKVVHYGKYDYESLNYKSYRASVDFSCSKHGLFKQVPQEHLAGKGCPKCGIESRSDKSRNTIDLFIDAAIKIHGDIYSYAKAVYGDDNKTKLIITCKEHGDFKQSPNSHLKGSGCPKCKLSSDNDAIYIWKAIGQYFNGEQVYKVGVTSSRLGDLRIKHVAKKIGIEYEIVTLRKVSGSAQALESKLMDHGFHPGYAGHDGATEFRAFTDSDLQSVLDQIEAYIYQSDEILKLHD